MHWIASLAYYRQIYNSPEISINIRVLMFILQIIPPHLPLLSTLEYTITEGKWFLFALSCVTQNRMSFLWSLAPQGYFLVSFQGVFPCHSPLWIANWDKSKSISISGYLVNYFVTLLFKKLYIKWSGLSGIKHIIQISLSTPADLNRSWTIFSFGLVWVKNKEEKECCPCIQAKTQNHYH